MRHEVDDAAVLRGDIATGLLALAAALAPAARARSVRHAAGAAALVAACCISLGLKASRARAGAAAIALAAIAAAAQQHLRTATRTHEQAGGMVDQLPGSSGNTPEDGAARGRGAAMRNAQYTGAASASARCRARRAVLELPG